MKYLLLLISFTAHALTPAHLHMPIDHEYMQMVVGDYLKWHEQQFKINLFNKAGKDSTLIQQALKKLDHWKVSGTSLDQFLVGLKMIDHTPSYYARVHLHPELRTGARLKNIWFIEWDSAGELCLLEKRGEDFYHHCKKDHVKKVSKLSPVGEMNWPHPFPEFSGETIKTYRDEVLVKVFFQAKLSHLSRIPQSYHHYINTHGQELLLPFDKYATERFGDLTVYYP